MLHFDGRLAVQQHAAVAVDEERRVVATPFLAELRQAVGLRRFQALGAAPAATSREKPAAEPLATFKQYRESDGLFYFKLVGAGGDALLLQSRGFEQGREAGAWVARLKKEGAAALADAPVTLSADEADVRRALDRLAEAA